LIKTTNSKRYELPIDEHGYEWTLRCELITPPKYYATSITLIWQYDLK
jgi:hypothetical protein